MNPAAINFLLTPVQINVGLCVLHCCCRCFHSRLIRRGHQNDSAVLLQQITDGDVNQTACTLPNSHPKMEEGKVSEKNNKTNSLSVLIEALKGHYESKPPNKGFSILSHWQGDNQVSTTDWTVFKSPVWIGKVLCVNSSVNCPASSLSKEEAKIRAAPIV